MTPPACDVCDGLASGMVQVAYMDVTRVYGHWGRQRLALCAPCYEAIAPVIARVQTPPCRRCDASGSMALRCGPCSRQDFPLVSDGTRADLGLALASLAAGGHN